MKEFISMSIAILALVLLGFVLWFLSATALIWALNILGLSIEYGFIQYVAILVVMATFNCRINIKNN